MSNPVFSNSPAFSPKAAQRQAEKDAAAARAAAVAAIPVPSAAQLDEHLAMPDATAAQMDRMSYEDTIVKTAISFLVLVAGAAIGWFLPIVLFPALIVGLVIGLVNSFKREPSPVLILIYCLAEGALVGAVSGWYSQVYDSDIVPMAVFGTLGVVAVTLALFASGKVRASRRATKIFLVAIVGYLAFSVVNFGLMVFGVTKSMNGLRDVVIPGTNIPLGIPLGILVVIMAAYSLVIDFDFVQRGVQTGQPRRYGWTAAFGIVVTVVWLYLEILRLISYFMPRN
jgi:uncharacterized YccA/Bax inhibitor family protein